MSTACSLCKHYKNKDVPCSESYWVTEYTGRRYCTSFSPNNEKLWEAIKEIIELTSYIDEGSVFGHDTDIGRIEALIVEAIDILKDKGVISNQMGGDNAIR